MVVGLIGIVLPALPGTVLIFVGLVVAAWADHFTKVGIPTLVLLAILAAASYTVDLFAAAVGVKHLGATRRAAAGAAFGTICGLFFGLPGIIVGPFVGAVIGELTARRGLAHAGRAGLAAWIGFVIGTGIKVGIAFVMLGIFVAALMI